jgi:hypothetical protein
VDTALQIISDESGEPVAGWSHPSILTVRVAVNCIVDRIGIDMTAPGI